ncbi:GMC oxidoreductase [Cupriavidus basilensis]
MASLAPVLNKPWSRGTVTLCPKSPQAESVVAFNLLSDARDLARMTDAFRFTASLFPELGTVCGTPYVLGDAGNLSRLMRFNEPTRANAMRARRSRPDSSTRCRGSDNAPLRACRR